MNGWMDGWMDGWLAVWIDGWDGWMDTHTQTHTHAHPPTRAHTPTHSPVASPFYVLPLIEHLLAFYSKCTDSSTDECSNLMPMCEKRTSSNPVSDYKFTTFL